ncbi:hypothetical protein M438DRAFT_349360 [Aureobasidium pullulans EXF-150]|uniref:Uncharacterized protein n=1 Tax=Aureobasidium pullulans EXF-150 TaxID=1043002 RepID=A0A074XCW6_AURPU|nr:uncharacterized protein M438DRAFT_349360 [Aureobasidium pullulans EXF-150]KEQ79877.1 hypothetical protein M438DRAFT_349360 [Aureobasidium pullulans EXF-150]
MRDHLARPDRTIDTGSSKSIPQTCWTTSLLSVESSAIGRFVRRRIKHELKKSPQSCKIGIYLHIEQSREIRLVIKHVSGDSVSVQIRYPRVASFSKEQGTSHLDQMSTGYSISCSIFRWLSPSSLGASISFCFRWIIRPSSKQSCLLIIWFGGWPVFGVLAHVAVSLAP